MNPYRKIFQAIAEYRYRCDRSGVLHTTPSTCRFEEEYLRICPADTAQDRLEWLWGTNVFMRVCGGMELKADE